MDGNISIAPFQTQTQIDTLCNQLLSQPLFASLLSQVSPGCFYIYFTESSRRETESTGFITPRGGSHKSKSKRRVVKAKASRPVLLKPDGSFLKASELHNDGWIISTLFEERYVVTFVSNNMYRNWANVASVERTLQKKTMYIPIGRRLHRNFCGGAKVKEQDRHMRFVVYLMCNKKGFGNLLLDA
jgi:hypothetical protein